MFILFALVWLALLALALGLAYEFIRRRMWHQ
jgi:hypothetical protein